MSMRPPFLAAAAALTVLLAAGLFAVRLSGFGERAPQHATLLPSPVELPAFSLVDQDGAEFSRDSLLGRHSLLFFGFTHCPDICPATLQQLAVARRQLAERSRDPASASLPDILLISVDPERDTPEVLAAYAGHFGAGVRGVSGPPEEIAKLAGALGIFHRKVPGGDGNYSVDHSAAIIYIDQDARYRAVFSAPHDVAALAADIPVLMALR